MEHRFWYCILMVAWFDDLYCESCSLQEHNLRSRYSTTVNPRYTSLVLARSSTFIDYHKVLQWCFASLGEYSIHVVGWIIVMRYGWDNPMRITQSPDPIHETKPIQRPKPSIATPRLLARRGSNPWTLKASGESSYVIVRHAYSPILPWDQTRPGQIRSDQIWHATSDI